MSARTFLLAAVITMVAATALAATKTLGSWTFFDIVISTDREWMTTCDDLCGNDAVCLAVSSNINPPRGCSDILSGRAVCRCMKPAGA